MAINPMSLIILEQMSDFLFSYFLMGFLFPAVFQWVSGAQSPSKSKEGIDVGNNGEKRRTTRDGRKIVPAKMPTTTLAGRGEQKQFE